MLYCTTELHISSFNLFRKYLLSACNIHNTMLDVTGNTRMSKIQCYKGDENMKSHWLTLQEAVWDENTGEVESDLWEKRSHFQQAGTEKAEFTQELTQELKLEELGQTSAIKRWRKVCLGQGWINEVTEPWMPSKKSGYIYICRQWGAGQWHLPSSALGRVTWQLCVGNKGKKNALKTTKDRGRKQ